MSSRKLTLTASCVFAMNMASVVTAQEGTTQMDIMRKTDMQTVEGPAENFTGKATITGQFQRPDPSRVSGAIVHFESGARTAWHSHPAGQTLIVTEGGLDADRWRSQARVPCGRHPVVPGRTPALARRHADRSDDAHRHPRVGQCHAVTWMEKVTDEEHLAPLAQD